MFSSRLCLQITVLYLVSAFGVTDSPTAERWTAAKLKNGPASYGAISNGNSVTVQGKFTDANRTYRVLEEQGQFVKLTDGIATGWVFKSGLTSVAEPAISAPAPPNFPKTSVPNASRTQDPWIGKKVFYKDSAVARVGNEIIDKVNLKWPSRVEAVHGDWLWIGQAWLRKSDVMELQECFDLYVEEVRRKPLSSSAWAGRAVCWGEKGEFENAIKDYTEAIRLNPKTSKFYSGRGASKHMLKNHEAAILDYTEAIRLNPQNDHAYLGRGKSKGKLNDLSGAINDYDQAIRLNATNSDSFHCRAWNNHRLEKWTDAIHDYERSIQLAPKEDSQRSNLSLLFSTAVNPSIRDPHRAMVLADETLTLNPKSGYSMNTKACALAANNDFTSAIDWETKALADKEFSQDGSMFGGQYSESRIARWRAKELWFPKLNGK